MRSWIPSRSTLTTIGFFGFNSGVDVGLVFGVGEGDFFSSVFFSSPSFLDNWKAALYYSGAMFLVSAACWALIDPRQVIVYAPADRRRLAEEGPSAERFDP